MAKILVHHTCGPENPTKAALAFFVARAAAEEGHASTMFLAGDAVPLLRDAILDSLVGVGTGKLREHYDVFVANGGKLFVSKASAAARGVTEEELKGKPYEFGTPQVLVRLALEHDRVITY